MWCKQEKCSAGLYWLLVYAHCNVHQSCICKQHPQWLICHVADKLLCKHILHNSYTTKEFRSSTPDTFRFSPTQPEGKINGYAGSRAWWHTIIMELVWNNTLVMWYPSLFTLITVQWAMGAAQMIGCREGEMSMCRVPDLVFSIYWCVYLGCVFVRESPKHCQSQWMHPSSVNKCFLLTLCGWPYTQSWHKAYFECYRLKKKKKEKSTVFFLCRTDLTRGRSKIMYFFVYFL